MNIINLKELEAHLICALGEKVKKYNENDIKFIRTTVCENSYIEIKTNKGLEILESLKKEYKF